MRPTPSHITTAVTSVRKDVDERERIKRSREFLASERALGYWAVCLIGPSMPVRRQAGNATIWPVGLRTATVPSRAPQRDASSHWEGSKATPFIVLLRHVWTRSDAHADRLKSALHAQLLGDDPDMRQLNAGWVDRMDWERSWQGLLNEAIKDLQAGGETIEVFNDEMWFQRIKKHADARARGTR